MKDTLYFLLQSLLQKHKINVDHDELAFQIKSHPSYPSLHAVTGVLSHFNIENVAIKVPVNDDTLAQLPICFLAQIRNTEGEHIVLVIKKGLNYKLVFNPKENSLISSKIFLEQFTGIVVAVEKDETNTSIISSTINYRNTFSIISIAIFIALFFLNRPSLFETFYFILSTIGIGVSYLIIQHDLGIDSKIVNTICSQESKTTNCNAVLNSKGATLFKNIKLSDISFIYFIALTLLSAFFSMANLDFVLLFQISLLSVPIISYSIYYQAVIVKNWCTLCLIIVTILTFQASLIFFVESFKLNVSVLSILIIALSFLSTASLWLLIAAKLKKEQEFKTSKIEATKFKRNFDLFNTLLEKSETINTTIPISNEIIFGNKNAPLNIIVVTNPFCGHCKGVHSLVESILKHHHNDLSVTVRFNINTSNLESDGVLVSTRLIELFHTEGELKCLEAMHDIYNNVDAKSWLNKWKKCSNTHNYKTILETESHWCLDNNINFTPELLINGKVYPKAYDRGNLAFFIEDLNEYYYEKTTITKLQNTI